MKNRLLNTAIAVSLLLAPAPALAGGELWYLSRANANEIKLCVPETDDCVIAQYATSADQMSVTENPQEVCTDRQMSDMLVTERHRDNSGFPDEWRYSMESALELYDLSELIASSVGRNIFVGIYECATITPSVGTAVLICADPATHTDSPDMQPLYVGCSRATLGRDYDN